MPSPTGMGLALATILAASIESILYGISLVMCGGAVWALVRRPRDEINWSMALVALVLTGLSTIHLTVNIQRLVDGFIIKSNVYPGGPTGFFADVTQRTFFIKKAIYILQTLLGDGIVIYRCYVAWQCFRIVILPMLLWCAASATSAAFLYRLRHAADPNTPFLGSAKFVVSFYLLTMATNALGSGLLAYRIWSTSRNVPGVVRVLSRSGVEATLILRILVDAMALYAFTLLILLVCHALQCIGQFIILDMMTPIISISFSMVLIRIAIAREDATIVPRPLLSPIRFAATPSPSEHVFTSARRCSI